LLTLIWFAGPLASIAAEPGLGSDEASIRAWRRAAAEAKAAQDATAQVRALVNLTGLYQGIGQHALAQETAQEANALAPKASRATRAAAKNALGMVYLFKREPEAAERELTLALAGAVEAQQDGLIASVMNNIGNLEMSRRQFDEAAQNYEDSAGVAARAGDRGLQVKARVNEALARFYGTNAAEASRVLEQAGQELASLPASPEKNGYLMTLGSVWEERALRDPAGQNDQRAAALYEEALRGARSLDDRRTIAYAAGHLGRLRARSGAAAEAEAYLQEGISQARTAGLDDALFRWQWELARLKKAQGKRDEAVATYEQAIDTFQPLLTDWVVSVPNWQRTGSFRDEIGPMYFELADLLLQQASNEPNPAASQALLRRAQETLERLKAGEFADYFQETCVDKEGPVRRSLGNVPQGAAVIYVVPLPDRTELLVGLGNQLHRFTAPVTDRELTATVRDFRRKLEKRTTREYMVGAQKLNNWLIAPAADTLKAQQVRTLVFVPDGALRTVPLSALHDGKDFLAARFAVAVVPGLTLVDPKPLHRVPRRMLLTGLSESVQGFPALDYVPGEVKTVHDLFGGKVLLNQEFATGHLEQELNTHGYTLVHVASHAEFSSDLRKTALLTYDGRVSLQQLEESIRPCQHLGRPVELLALSACQTAAGDDRAALGLAGVALKAGARSALATWWFVNDEASSALVSEFYRQLRSNEELSKAGALQAAQLHLMQDERYQHPAYWGPYLIIGNWL
jgi:CHAT domain-containing protein